MKKNIQRIISIMLILFLLIPSIVMADTGITIGYIQEGNNATVSITGVRNRSVSITIKDQFRYHYMDQGTTDDLGKAEFKVTLELGKSYDCQVNIDGKITTKKIIMEEVKEEPNPDPGEDQDAKVDLYIKGYSGVILNQQNIKIREGETALGLTTRMLDDQGISYENRFGYIASIDGQKEFDKGKDSGWMFSVNNKFPDVGAGSITLKDGDKIKWLYTYDLGEDIGAPIQGGKDGEKDGSTSEIIDEALKTIKNEKADETMIGKAIDSIARYFTDKTTNLKPSEIKEVVDNGTKASQALVIALEKAETENLRVKIADSSIAINKSLNNIIDSKTDKAIIEKIGQIAQENMGISLDTVNKIKNKSKINSLIDDMIETSIKIEDKLSHIRLQPNKNSEKIIGIKVLEKEENSIKVTLPHVLLEKATKRGVDKIKTISSLAHFDIAPDFLNKSVKEDVNIIMVKETSGLVIEFKLGTIVLDEFGKPIKIRMSYDKAVKDKDKITAILIREDGAKEIIGGIYDELTKTIKFLTNKPGKFTIEERTKEFKDIKGHKWAEVAIESMAVKGIIDGRTKDIFDPSANITRAEFTALISRILKYNEGSDNEMPFKDVNNNNWYYNAIASVYENGLINGKTSTNFDPEGNITREEIVKIIGQILKNDFYKEQDNKKLDRFIDKDSISQWAGEGASMVVSNGIINGDNGKFMPKQNATRAETAVILYRLYELIMN